MFNMTSKISAALAALVVVSAISTQADAHTGPFHGHAYVHWNNYHHYNYSHYSYQHYGLRQYRWHAPVTIVGVGPRDCPVGYHLGYLGKHCWKNA